MSTHSDDVAQEAINRASSTGKAVGGKAVAAGKKATQKIGKKVLKVIGRAVVQGVGWLASALAPVLLPLLIGALIVGGLFSLCSFLEFESRPKTQDQQNSLHGMNQMSGDSIEEISDENLIIKAFYINYSNQSYYQTLKGKDEIYHVSEGKEIDGELIVDKYGNEEKFKLSPDLLWTLDEYVFNKQIRFPEAFLRPVHVDENMELQPLIDENGISVESQKYDENGNLVEGETTKGIWGYGLSPIISYDQFEEKAFYLYTTTTKDVWSDEQQKVVQVPIESGDAVYDEKKVNVDGYPRKVFLIDSIATFMGTARNTIVSEEKNTGQPAPSLEKVKYGEAKIEREECKTRYSLKLILTLENGTTKTYEANQVTLSWSDHDENLTYVKNKKTGAVIDQIKGAFTQEKKMGSEVICETKIDVYPLYKYFEGYRYEEIPRYEGETEFGELLGDEYLHQYLEAFQTYVPEDVVEDFDLEQRMKDNPERLKEIVQMYEVSRQSEATSASLEIPATDQGKLVAAAKYDALFLKYGEMYGTDPYLLRAMAAQESSGNHEAYLSPERCSSAGCGLMQIEMPGKEVTQATAWRFKDDLGNDITPYKETIKVCLYGTSSSDCADVSDIEKNIQIGAMQLAQRFSVFDYNIMLSIQAYNFGEGGIRKVLSLYGTDYGKTVDSIIASPNDLGWLDYRIIVNQNPGLLGAAYSGYRRYGDATYLEKILSFLPANHVITIKMPDGMPVYANSNIEGVVRDEGGVVQEIISNTVSGITNVGSKLGSFFNKLWNNLQDVFTDLFTDHVDYLNKTPDRNTTLVESAIKGKDIDNIILMIMAFEEEDYMGNINPNTDPEERAKVLFNSVFAKSNDSAWQMGEAGSDLLNADPYFGGNVVSPLKGSENQTILVHHNKLVGTTYHNGVDVFAPYGTNVKAISEGEILEVGTSSDEHIGHYVKISHGKTTGGTIMVSVYGRLDPSSTAGLQVGDKVAKEQKIGTVAEASDSQEQSLHFELLSNSQQIDPSYIFSPLYSGDVPMTNEGFVAPVSRGRISCYLLCSGYPGSWHDGVDIARTASDKANDVLPKILAGNSGVIIRVQRSNSGYGNNILIKHNVNGKIYVTLYAHLNSFAPGVQEGAVVTAGQYLGDMGTTGMSTGVHLHFGVYENNYVVKQGIPPAPFLPIASTAAGTYVGMEPQQ